MKIIKKTVVFLLAMLFVLPFIYLALLSIAKDWIYPEIIPRSIEIGSWLGIIQWNDGLLGGLLNSLWIAGIVAACSTALGFLLSRVLSLYSNTRLSLLTCYLPFVISPVIYAVLLNYFFIRLDLNGTVFGVMMAQLIITVPFSIILFRPFWNARVNLMEEISYTLGSSEWNTFAKVLLPVAKSQLIICFLQTFLVSWFEFGLTSFIGLGKVETLTVKLYQYIGEANLPYSAISCLIIILPPAVLLWINRKFVFTKFE